MMSPNGGPDRPYLQSQPSNLTQDSQRSVGQQQLRFKIYWQEDTIVMRFPQDMTFQELIDRLRQRVRAPNAAKLSLKWEEQPSKELHDLVNDQTLDDAINRNMGQQVRVYASYTED